MLARYPTIFDEHRHELGAAAETERSARSAKRKNEQVVASLDTEQVGIQAGVLVNQ